MRAINAPHLENRMDIRTLSRYTAATSLVVGSLALAIPISYYDGDAPGATQLRQAAEHAGMLKLSNMLLAVQILVVPAMLYVGRLARGGAPRLAFVGGGLSALGWLAGLIGLGSAGVLVYQGTTVPDQAAVASLIDKVSSDPAFGLLTLIFVIGHVIGMIVLGAALWRSHAVPTWTAVLFMLVPVGHLLGHFFSRPVDIVDGYAFALCCIVCAVAVLRRSNDRWDLPAGRSAARPAAEAAAAVPVPVP
jgi:hypothetical protein